MPYYPGQQLEVDIFIEIQPTVLSQQAAAGAATITVIDPSRWTNGVAIKIGDGDPQLDQSELRVATTIVALTGVITLDAPLRFGYPPRTPVYRLSDATVTGQIKKLVGGPDVATVTNVSTGRKRVTYSDTVEGKHVLEAVASGAVVSAGAVEFIISKDEV